MNALRTLTALLLGGALLASTPALAADPGAAQALYDRGLSALNAGRYDEACPALEQSYQLDPLPGALFTLADCEAKRGHFTAAAARYDEYLRVYAALPPDKQAKQGKRDKLARTERAAIALKVAELTLVLPPGAPRETQVTRDGAPLPAAALGVPALVDPGEHVITVQVPGGPVSEMRVSLGPGEKKGVALDARQAGGAVTTSPGAPPGGGQPGEGASKALLIAGGSVVGAAAIAGAVLLGVSAGKGNQASTLFTTAKAAGGCPPATSTTLTGICASLKSDLDAKSTLGSAGVWLLAGAGVVGISTLIYGLAAGPRAARSGLVIAPVVTGEGGGIFARGSF